MRGSVIIKHSPGTLAFPELDYQLPRFLWPSKMARQFVVFWLVHSEQSSSE
jgi:hypothetical protein